MTILSPSAHDIILRQILYGMLTGWIPVPFADLIAGNMVRRQMITGLSELYDAKLPQASVKVLADDHMGCVHGCLVNVLLFPLKLTLGKLFLLIRFKRFIDEASRNYHAARLIDFAMRAQLLSPAGPHSAEQVRARVNEICDKADVGPVSAVFGQILKKKAGVLKDAARFFWRSLQSVKRRRSEEQVQQAVNEAERESADFVSGVLAPLRTALDSIPAEHFTRLEAQLEAMLRES